jgi:hypothetical protein
LGRLDVIVSHSSLGMAEAVVALAAHLLEVED